MEKAVLAFVLVFLFASTGIGAELTGIRFSKGSDKVRIVFDLSSPVEHKIGTAEGQLSINLYNTETTLEAIGINDPFVESVNFNKIISSPEALQAVLDVRQKVRAKIFVLDSPYRIVIDLIKKVTQEAEQKPAEEKKIVWTKLEKTYFAKSNNGVRIVLQASGLPDYYIITSESEVRIDLPYTLISEKVQKKTAVDDNITDFFGVEKKENNTIFSVPLNYYVRSKVFNLEKPSRIVVDLYRIYESEETKDITPAIKYSDISLGVKSGPIEVHSLKIDKNLAEIYPVLAKPKIKATKDEPKSFFENIWSGITSVFSGGDSIREKSLYKKRVSQMVADNGAIAGVNSTYFSAKGRPLGVLMIDGNLISSPINKRTALIQTSDSKFFIDNVNITGYLEMWDGSRLNFDGINTPILHNEIIVYTPEFGDTNQDPVSTDIIVSNGVVSEIRSSNSKIPRNGFVVSAHGVAGEALKDRFKIGDNVDIKYEIQPNIANIKHIVGGGPRLVKNGKIHITGNQENFRSDILNGRAARTALGITADGNIMLVSVDGRARSKSSSRGNLTSIGMSLKELAQFMKDHGAVDAMNFDGGGSTTMVVSGEVVNNPADGIEKNVVSAIVVRSRTSN